MLAWLRRLLGLKSNPFVDAEHICPACKCGVVELDTIVSSDGYWPGWPATPRPEGWELSDELLERWAQRLLVKRQAAELEMMLGRFGNF